MNSTSTQFVASRRIGVYEPLHQLGMWGDFNEYPDTILHVESKLDNHLPDPSNEFLIASNSYDQEPSQASRPPEKVQRRLAQNREAARKSRLRKKAYVQQLENCKLRLLQLEQELHQAKQQGRFEGIDVSQLNCSSSSNSVNNAFELEYGKWVEEQNRQTDDLRNALLSQVSDAELCLLVDGVMIHYSELFRMKFAATKTDVFYVTNGTWKTPVERLFLWIGGFRPSEILKSISFICEEDVVIFDVLPVKILLPHVKHLSEEQHLHICNLARSCQQAEDALTQGRDKLHEITADTVADGRLGEANYLPQIEAAMEKLEALVRFVNQADNLRQETIQQMYRILTMRQSARALLVLGEYFQRLRSLSAAWNDRLHESLQQQL